LQEDLNRAAQFLMDIEPSRGDSRVHLDENGVPISEYNLLMSSTVPVPAVAALTQASFGAPQVKLEAWDGGAKRVYGAIVETGGGAAPQQVHTRNLAAAVV